MWRAADHQEGGDRCDRDDEDVVRDVEARAGGGSQGPVEVLFLDKSPGSQGEFNVGGPAP